ncbi:MAG TPA: hypothetical protein VNV88_08345 [Candidatus Solibacter sp.]|jgi:hypothetical protein|nr:hypothetical protein [Candidatus Solibacter sp.]
MPPFPNLPANVGRALDHYVVPAILAWFLVRWFRLVPDDDTHKKAFKAIRMGLSAGVLGASAVLLAFSRFGLNDEADISRNGAIFSVIAGAIAGAISRFVPARLTGNSQDELKGRAMLRCCIVFLAYTGGLSAFFLYYSYSHAVHQSILWASVALAIAFQIVAPLGD